MSAFIAKANADQKLRKAHILAQSTESLAEAQAALDDARMRYDNFPSKHNAYRITAARDRVAAAQERDNEAYHAEQDEKLAQEKVRNKKEARRVVAQVEALTTTIPSLAEWSRTPNGQEYMDLPPDADLMQELRTARMI